VREAARDRLSKALATPRVVPVAALATLLLSLPSIPTGWYLDDLVHRAQFLEVGPMTDSSNMTHRMYDFLSGDPKDTLAYKDIGVLPWWAEDELKIRFWRPLSSLTHVADYAIWPESALLMHAHSVVWLAGLVAMTALLYRRLIAAPMVAGLAALLYAIDDAHGMPVAFLANRNAIVAAFFGVLSLWSHDRFRREGWTVGSFLSPLAFLAALLAGESGIGIAPYLLGYALFLERKAGLARFASIAPHAAVGVAWLAFYHAGGYGTSGSGFYLDPMRQPGEWLGAFLVRAPLLLLGQWFVPPSSFAFVWTPAQAAAVAAFGGAFLAILFSFLMPILRSDATARFFVFGMLLAVVPITAGFPHDRLLFFVGIGGMALLSMLLFRLFDRSRTGWPGRLLGFSLVVAHFAIAPPLHLLTSTSVASQEPIYADPPRSLPPDPKLEEERLVVVNQPNAFYGQYVLVVRAFDGKPVPKSLLMLAPGTSALMLERPSENTLVIEAEDGWLRSPFDNVYRDPSRPLPPDYSIELSDVRVRVMESTPDGAPKKVEFTFAESLEHDSLRWVLYREGRYVPFEVPSVGEKTMMDPVPFSLLSPPAGPKEET
jgi:hypothetical protein